MPRGRPKKMVQCWQCPPDADPIWIKEVKFKSGLPVCKQHQQANQKPIWPSCPNCDSDDIEWMEFSEWKGKEEKIKVTCVHCAFTDLAINHFNKYTIWNMAAPIERGV